MVDYSLRATGKRRRHRRQGQHEDAQKGSAKLRTNLSGQQCVQYVLHVGGKK